MTISISTDAGEVAMLADEMAHAYARMVRFYVKERGLSLEDAHAQASRPPNQKALEILESSPPDQTTWHDLQQLTTLDPARALARWSTIQEAACEELASGQRAAKAVEGSPFGRARFFAIRSSFTNEWQPQNGIERSLIDSLAQLQTCYLYWLERFTVRMMLEADSEISNRDYDEKWRPSRITDAEAIEQAGQMIDRLNRLFLRSLRALRDLRRAGVVTINAAQVNIAQQQVNAQQVNAKSNEQ